MLLLCALWLSICGCGQIAHGFSASKYGMSCRVLQPGLHVQACMLRCIHLHPLLARVHITNTAAAAPRCSETRRKLPSMHILPTAGFRISQSGGLLPPHPHPPGVMYTCRNITREEEGGMCPEEQREEAVESSYFMFWLRPLKKSRGF